MKAKRQELIDFINWLSEKRVNPAIHNPEALVDQYWGLSNFVVMKEYLSEKEKEVCEWKPINSAKILFDTECGKEYAKDDFNEYKYCPFCGKKIQRI